MSYMIAGTIGIMVFCFILLQLNAYGQKMDQVKTRLNKVGTLYNKGLSAEDEMSKPLSERFIKPIFEGMMGRMKKYLPEEKSSGVNLQSKQANKIKSVLYQAGIKLSVNQYIQIRFIVLAGTGALFGLIGLGYRFKPMYLIFLVVLGVYLAYVVFRFDLARRVSKRKEFMQRQMPEVLDMLSVSVEAGLGLEQAMIHVVDHFNGPLIDEIAVANREMAMGRNRKEALLLLGERCDIDEMKSFVRAIVQASQLGISIKNVLRSQAAFMRQTRKNKVEEKAMKVSVKILLPMAFFIFPVLFIVLLGPAFVSIAENFL